MIPDSAYTLCTLVCAPLSFLLLFALYRALYAGKRADEWRDDE